MQVKRFAKNKNLFLWLLILISGLTSAIASPESYSAKDKQQLGALEKLARKKHIPYFTCRGKDLPNGWKQVN